MTRQTVLLPGRTTGGGASARGTRLVLETFEPRLMLDAGPLVLSEFLAINNGGLTDADGDASDWIEIYNPTTAAVDLDGWYLTDDEDELSQWRFPAVSIGPSEYRVIFASGKDRTDAAELHTNFQLDGDGEYLALVRPDGTTIAHQIAPEFPPQHVDVSCGPVPGTVETLVPSFAPAKAIVPGDGSLGMGWTAVGFDDGDWTAGTTGVGYETGVADKGLSPADEYGSHLAPRDEASSRGARRLLSLPSNQAKQGEPGLLGEYFDDSNLQQSVSQRVDAVIDFSEAEWGDGPPGTGVTPDDSYSERWTGFVHAPAAGDWTFYTYSNDGVRLWVDGVQLIDNWSQHVATEDSGSVNLDAGWHPVRLEHFQQGGTVVIRLSFAGPGQAKQVIPSTHLNTEAPPPPGYEDLLGIDLRAEMLGIGETAYVRIPFSVADPATFDSLGLRMKYDDGFAAYLGGVEVARRNAPASLKWDSAATAEHADAEAVAFEDVDISDHLGDLLPGANVLAVHGLNYGAHSPDFLVLPELIAGSSQFGTGSLRYFTTPTPGAVNGDGLLGIVEDTSFSHHRGFYDAPFDVAITTGVEGATVVYTTDGSPPTPNHGIVYTEPIPIHTTTVLRAMAFKDGFLPTNVDTQTYIFLGALDGSHNGVINQPANVPGYPNPRTWAGGNSYVYHDYQMDPEVVYDPGYRGVIHDALRAVPTMSITCDPGDVFGGFYDRDNVEKPVSVEIIYAHAPQDNHQAEAGIESHSHDRLKRSLRLNFRSEYGDAKLQTDLFQTGSMHGQTAVDRIDRIILRGGNNRSWARIWNPDKTAYTIDQLYRDLQVAMSGYGSRGAFVHLYINGLYWGLYNPTERTDQWFTSAYFGGEPDDWFAVNHGGDLSGDDGRYDYLRNTLAGRDMTNPANYAEMRQYLDVEGFIDYLLVSWWTGTGDWPGNNFYGGNRNATSPLGPEPFRYFAWDGEWSWDSPRGGSVQGQVHPDFRSSQSGGSTIPRLWHALRRNDDFLMLFADRVYKHFFHDGVLTDANAQARWLELNELIRQAVVAESARWGDSLQSLGGNYPLRTRDVDWQREVDAIFNRIAGNAARLIGGGSHSLRDEGYYPHVDPPQFNRHGGQVSPGFNLTLSAPSGTIYYTLDGGDPRLPGGGVSPDAQVFDASPVTLNESVLARARAKSGGQWSALNQAQFLVERAAAAENLVVTELNYNPYPPTAEELAAGFLDNDEFEFIELRNLSGDPVTLIGVALVDGVQFDFDAGGVRTLPPGGSVVVARNPAAFQARYPAAAHPAGQYDGQLRNEGEQIRLTDYFGNAIAGFSYDSQGRWPGRADGKGATLELIDPGMVPIGQPARTAFLGDADNWRSSSEYGGTPGGEGTGPREDVVVNELLANTPPPMIDAIELHNATAVEIAIGGWYLSDSWGWDHDAGNGNYKKFRIPDQTVIPAGGYLVFDETDFSPSGGADPADFALDADHGDDVWLMEADQSGRLVRFVDHAEFGAMAEGRSWGRWPDGTGVLYPMVRPTLDRDHPEDGPNSGPRTGSVVISELHYDPHAGPDDDDLEFIEIYNTTAAAVELGNWRIRKGIDYDFPARAELGPGGTLIVVPFDPGNTVKLAAFYDAYWPGRPVPPGLVVLGGYSGRLRDAGERVQLQRPGEQPADEPGFFPGLLEDEVRYEVSPPWPADAAGGGRSLHRAATDAWGNSAAGWEALTPTPGSTPFAVPIPAEVVTRHVFYNGSGFDGNDLRADARDDAAVAPDKAALLPGETATFANYTSYSRGLNGVMVDVDGLPAGAAVGVDDFRFRLGNDELPDGWAPGPAPSQITVRPGAGAGGCDRITLIWADNEIQRQWLQVTVLATANTALAEEDVFYFGNAIGESGNSAADAKVGAIDMLGARDNQRNFLDPAPLDFSFDFDRDQRVNSVDMLIARNNQTHFLNALKLIAAPAGDAAMEEVAGRTGETPQASLAELDWLYELAVNRRSSSKHADPIQEGIDGLTAAYW